MTDRERILTTIVDQLCSTLLLAPGCRGYEKESFRDSMRSDASYYVHFAHYRDPEPGDLVLARTGGVCEWKVGWYIEKRDDLGGAVIREIGSDRLCNYGNESFVPIVGLGSLSLLEGDKYEFYVKVLRAFGRCNEYLYRFCGLRFECKEAVVTVREAFGGLGKESNPFDVRMVWSKRKSIKNILQVLRAGGYGTKSFR